MSVSTEVQRTLVKSPPELWTELSNPDGLGRHLGDLGEIRIVKVEPETTVEWEAEGARGVVHLKQSGWGTKVTLSLTREVPELAEPEPQAVAKPKPPVFAEPKPQAVAEPKPPVFAEPKPQAVAEPKPPVFAEPEPQAAAELERAPEAIPEPRPTTQPVAEQAHEPAPRPGFFARLLRRRNTSKLGRAQQALPHEPLSGPAEPQPADDSASDPEPRSDPEPETVALAAPAPIYPDPPIEPAGRESEPTAEPEQASKHAADLATELASVEQQMTRETTELLTGVLDRLGAAHHRPFSRG